MSREGIKIWFRESDSSIAKNEIKMKRNLRNIREIILQPGRISAHSSSSFALVQPALSDLKELRASWKKINDSLSSYYCRWKNILNSLLLSFLPFFLPSPTPPPHLHSKTIASWSGFFPGIFLWERGKNPWCFSLAWYMTAMHTPLYLLPHLLSEVFEAYAHLRLVFS